MTVERQTYTKITTQTSTENSSFPPTPQGEERENYETELEEGDNQTSTASNQIEGKPNLTASYPDNSCCLEKELPLSEDQSSADSPRDVTKCEVARVRKYDPALGIHPPDERKTRQQRQFDWVPDGPWLIDGKLDPNFVDWQAKDWIKAYGGDLHKKRADVLRHFKKDAANIAIAWSQYQSEQHHRYSNAALRMQHGMQIQREEQQQLLAHSRAITERLPEEMNPIAVGQNEGVSRTNTAMSALPANVVAFPCGEVEGENAASVSEDDRDQKLQASFPSSPSTANSNQAITHDYSPTTDLAFIPTDSDGFVENPDAYRVWKPQPLEGEMVTPQQFRERLAAMVQGLTMPKTKKKPHTESKKQ